MQPLANMAITFNPVLFLDLGKPTRVKVRIPLDLLAHFDPAVDLSAGKMHHLMRKPEPVACVIAEKLSIALFGSTESQRDLGRWKCNIAPLSFPCPPAPWKQRQ